MSGSAGSLTRKLATVARICQRTTVSHAKPLPFVLILVLVALLGATAGCSSDPDPVDREQLLEEAGIKPDESDNEIETSDDQTEAEIVEQLEGEIVIHAQLRPGECFNEYSYLDRTDVRQQFTTRVSCSRPHDKEMYAVSMHPADLDDGYIGNDELELWANKECLKGFEPYVGTEYVLSQLQIGIFMPDLESWSPPNNDRAVRCYLYVDGYNLQGSMQGIEI